MPIVRGLHLLDRAAPIAPPVDRGRLLTAEQVAELIGGVLSTWVRGKHRVGKDERPREDYTSPEGEKKTRRVGKDERPTLPNVPGKLTLGHSTVRWYEADVRAWLEEHRGAA